jgi:hypothetical protein
MLFHFLISGASAAYRMMGRHATGREDYFLITDLMKLFRI